MAIYLDSAATTQPSEAVVEAMARTLRAGFGNPSSRHGLGLEASRLVGETRALLARAIGATPAEIVFTGSGSEANNLALKGTAWPYARAGRHIVVSSVEHPSVLEGARWLAGQGFEVTYVPAGGDGRVDPAVALSAVTDETLLVSLMQVNNEVGAIEPVAEVARRLGTRRAGSGRRKGLPLLHVDAVQALGRVPVDARALGVDLLTVSAHKVRGPKGVGALFVRDGVRLAPLVHGGGQEAGRRSGTENVPGIAGFGAALAGMFREPGPGEGSGPAHWADSLLARDAAKMAALRGRLLELIREGWPGVVLNGPEDAAAAAPHILNLSFPGIPGEVFQHHLEGAGVYVSTGSACSSHHQGRPSHVLEAMGRPAAVAASSIRLSLSPTSTEVEVAEAGRAVVDTARALAGKGGRPLSTERRGR